MKRPSRCAVLFVVVGALIGPWLPASGGIARAQQSGEPVTVTSQQTPYGKALFTGDGYALYLLTADTQGTSITPARSSCTDKCAAAWPPLLAPGPNQVMAAGGVEPAGLGTTQRPDGTFQVTYYGWPLYRFIADKAPGQTNGEDVGAFNGLWYLVNLEGQAAPGVATVNLESSAVGQVLSTPTAFNTYRSLYNLTADPPNATTCTGGCAAFWPPLLTSGPPQAGAGVDPSGLGTITRPDGTMQVTYFGTPLYLFAFDLGPGAKSGLTNGEDVVDQVSNGIWYLVSPTGASSPGPATIGTNSTSIGTILSFAKSSVYMFSGDTATSSTCTGLCSRIWNPVITTGAAQVEAGSGLDASDFGTITRPDGTVQVTYYGHPLYTFALDYAGTGGQGIAAYGGTFSLMQEGGAPASGMPAQRSVVAIPQLSRSGGGMQASFTVVFSSSKPGQGMVLFGSGPGCTGLVEVATQDAGAGTTSHSVLVTGNDLPGTVGDNGIQPGTTYSFEVITASSAGKETDDNKGGCYQVTIPTG